MEPTRNYPRLPRVKKVRQLMKFILFGSLLASSEFQKFQSQNMKAMAKDFFKKYSSYLHIPPNPELLIK
jgi:hypothetical protein